MRNIDQNELQQINGGNMVSFVSALTLNQNGYGVLPSIGIACAFSFVSIAATMATPTVAALIAPANLIGIATYGALGYGLSYLTTSN